MLISLVVIEDKGDADAMAIGGKAGCAVFASAKEHSAFLLPWYMTITKRGYAVEGFMAAHGCYGTPKDI